MLKLIVPIVYGDVDGVNEPIPNAMVFLQTSVSSAAYGVTGTDGSTGFNVDEELGDSQVTVSIQGYKSYTHHVHLSKVNQQIRIGLDADPSRPQDVILPGLELEDSFPEAPSRLEVLKAAIPFQGFIANTSQFGAFYSFGVECTVLNDEDLNNHCKHLKEQGFDTAMFPVSWRYSESDYSYPVPGVDLTNNFAEIRRRCEFIIKRGLKIAFFLSGDGLSFPKNADGTYPYNDPQGWTRGYNWLIEWVGDFIQSMKFGGKININQYALYFPGYDGVFYGWGVEGEVPDRQPERVMTFGNVARNADPDIYLAIEHTPGKIPVGEGKENFEIGGAMDDYDVVASEFNYNLHEDTCWQIVGRMSRDFIQPYDKPAGDDPNPPFILVDCPRGERVYIPMERKTYWWVRGLINDEQLKADVDYLKSMNVPNVV